MKKLLLLISLLLCHITIIAQTVEGNVSVKINETSTITLSTTYSRILQNNATGVSYRWYSNNQSIATVSYSSYKNCTVRGKASGSCKVYFHADFYIDGYYRTYDFYWNVTVSGIGGGTTIVNPTGASVNPEELTLDVGQEYQLGYSVTPTNATYNLEWSSNNNSIATVTAYTGKVKAVGPGATYVQMWVFRNDGGCDIVRSCKVTVNNSKKSITISDANVKSICLQNWDSDGDGELSEDEAALVTDIGTAFRGNTDIQSLDVLQHFTGLTSIGYEAFSGCSNLSSVVIPNSVTSIGTSAFIGCGSLSSVIIPKSVTTIGDGIFQGCSALTSIVVENGNTAFDSRDNCNAIIQTSINKMIAGCGSTTIPNTVTIIGKYACQSSSLTSITIPNSVVTIQDCAFRRCYNIQSVVIPNSVTAIGGRAFAECTALFEVNSEIESPFIIPDNTFLNCYSTTALYVPVGTKSLYETTGGWKEFMNIAETGSEDIDYESTIFPMLATSWNQESPFNDDCPEGTKAGCGAVAVAQILNYYKKPAHGYGHASYNSEDVNFEANPIDWNNIRNEYGSNSTDIERAAVARLVHQVGVAMKMQYDDEGSSPTDRISMMWGLQHYLHMSPQSRFRYRRYYSSEEWIRMLENELEAKRPVYYRGDHSSFEKKMAGHIFVIDGRDKKGRYHFNFGHASRVQDKYTSLNLINQGTENFIGRKDDGKDNVAYDYCQAMITSFFPAEGFADSDYDAANIALTTPIVINGDKTPRMVSITGAMTVSFQFKYANFTAGSIQYSIGFYQNGELKGVSTTIRSAELSDGGRAINVNRSFTLPTGLANGEYEMAVVSRISNTAPWLRGWDCAPNNIPVTVSGSTFTFSIPSFHDGETNLRLKAEPTVVSDGIMEFTVINPSKNNFEGTIKVTSSSTESSLLTSVYDGQEITYRFPIKGNNIEGVTISYLADGSDEWRTLSYKQFVSGDINGDGEVNGTDMVALVNVIMGKAVYDNADINEDGAVNGTDMVALVNIIMTANNNNAGEHIAARRGIENQEQSTVSVDAEIKQGVDKNKEPTIMLHNPQMDITMVQMDVTLPEGLSLREDGIDMLGRTTWSTHQLYTGNVGNRTTRLMLASGRNDLIQGTEGGIILLSLVASDEFIGGDVVLHNILCTSPDLAEVRPADFMLHVSNDATGVSEMEETGSGEYEKWYNLSGQRVSAPRKGIYLVGGKKIVK